MQTPIYLLSWALGLCSFWFIWTLGIKKVMLDIFRERLFELRFELFRLGMNGELPFDSESYRAIETLISGLLRFSHRVTFMTFAFSKIEQDRVSKDPDYVDVSQQVTLKLSRLDSKTQEKVAQILNRVRSAIFLHVAFTSLFFMAVAAFYSVGQLLGLWHPEKAKASVGDVIEREAYRVESKRPLAVAVA